MSSPADNTDKAGRMAALEAIGDMLMVLDMPVARYAALMQEIDRDAPGYPQLRVVGRKVLQIAGRIEDGA